MATIEVPIVKFKLREFLSDVSDFYIPYLSNPDVVIPSFDAYVRELSVSIPELLDEEEDEQGGIASIYEDILEKRKTLFIPFSVFTPLASDQNPPIMTLDRNKFQLRSVTPEDYTEERVGWDFQACADGRNYVPSEESGLCVGDIDCVGFIIKRVENHLEITTAIYSGGMCPFPLPSIEIPNDLDVFDIATTNFIQRYTI